MLIPIILGGMVEEEGITTPLIPDTSASTLSPFGKVDMLWVSNSMASTSGLDMLTTQERMALDMELRDMPTSVPKNASQASMEDLTDISTESASTLLLST